MPKFYFDINDGTGDSIDTEGCDMKDRVQARSELMEALYLIGCEADSDSDRRDITAIVRDSKDKVIFEAKLFLVSKWRD
jgi:hypothetical protein